MRPSSPWLVIATVAAVSSCPGAAVGQSECLPEASRTVLECAQRSSPAPRTRRAPVMPQAAAEPRTQDNTTAEGPGLVTPTPSPARRDRQRRLLQHELTTLRRLADNVRADDPRRAAILQRLATTLDEAERQAEVRVRGLDAAIHRARAARDSTRFRELRRRQRSLAARRDGYRQEAVQVWARLVRDHPSAPNPDEAVFALARGLERLGEPGRARQAYHHLLGQHPDSAYVPHAWLAFAEQAFATGDIAEAQGFYERVTSVPPERNTVYGYALYKRAWCHYNLEDWRGALARFVEVIEHAAADPRAVGADALARQARRELVLPYAHVGRPARALAFFRRYAADEEGAMAMLDRLARVYEDTGQWQKTIATYHRLMAAAPESTSLCDWQHRTTRAVIASRPKPEQVRELRRLVDLYEGLGADDEARSQCAEDAASTAVELAVAWHREAVGSDAQPGTRNETTMDLADAVYRLALDSFPGLDELALARFDARDRPTRLTLAFYRAELLWTRERYVDCGPAYDAIAERAEAPLAEEASYAAVLCYQRVWETTYRSAPPESATPEADSDDAPGPARAPTELEGRMLVAFERFACQASDEADEATVRYRLGRIYHDMRRYEEAAHLFRAIALEHPEHEVGEFAANLYLDSLAAIAAREPERRADCFAAVRSDLRPIHTSYCGGDHPGQVCSVVATLACQLRRHGAEQHARRGDDRRAGDAYMAIVRDHPSCGDVPEMLWNAALHYEAVRLLGRAIAAREQLVRDHPEHGLVPRATYLAGAGYHALAMYERAAERYERFVRLDTEPCAEDADETECPDPIAALTNAVFFRLGLSQLDEARADAQLFARRFSRGHAQQSARVGFAIGVALEETDPRAAARHVRTWLRGPARHASPEQRLAAGVLLGRVSSVLGDTRGATAAYERVVQRWQAGALEAVAEDASLDEVDRARALFEGRDAVAEAPYHLADAPYRELMAMRAPRFRGSRSMAAVTRWSRGPLLEWLGERRAALGRTEEAYNRIAELDIPRWSIAAAARVGQAYAGFVDVLRNTPVPREIEQDEELIVIYLETFERLAQMFEGPAADKYTFCLRTATALRWFGDDSQLCERELHRLSPRSYPMAAELRRRQGHERGGVGAPGAVTLTAAPEAEETL